MSERMTAAERQEAREEVLWNLGVELDRALGAVEDAGLHMESVYMGGRSYSLGTVLAQLQEFVEHNLTQEDE